MPISISAVRTAATLLALALAGCGNSNPIDEDSGFPPEDSGNKGSEGGTVSQPTVTVRGNALVVQSCGVVPATRDLPAGNYTISLGASTLSKGNVTTKDVQPVKSTDNYVLVNLPLPAGDKNEHHRFFMLNGVGSSYAFSLPSGGRVQAMFIDSDMDANTGSATVTIQPGGFQLKVDAVANVLRWKQGCNANPAATDLKAGKYQLQLAKSSLSIGSGSRDDFVVIRSPSEDPSDDKRYLVLNGVNGSAEINFTTSGTMRAWGIGLQRAPGGDATVVINPR